MRFHLLPVSDGAEVKGRANVSAARHSCSGRRVGCVLHCNVLLQLRCEGAMCLAALDELQVSE